MAGKHKSKMSANASGYVKKINFAPGMVMAGKAVS
jgi:hypothetical protein